MDAADALMKAVEPSEEGMRFDCQNFLQAECGAGDAARKTLSTAPVTEGNILPTMYIRPYVDTNPINSCLKCGTCQVSFYLVEYLNPYNTVQYQFCYSLSFI